MTAPRLLRLDWDGAPEALRLLGGGALVQDAAGGLHLRLTGDGPARILCAAPKRLRLRPPLPETPPDAPPAPVLLVQDREGAPVRDAVLPDGRCVPLSRLLDGMACFGPGTRIATPDGPREIAALRPGDPVLTRDNGIKPVLWRGETPVDPGAFGGLRGLAPVEIAAGVLGPGQPERPLRLSPNHRVLIAETASALHFGEREVLVAARDLAGLGRARRLTGREAAAPVLWQHILLPGHEIVLADGAWCETLQPVPEKLSGFSRTARSGIAAALRMQGVEGRDWAAPRILLTAREAALLATGG